MEFRVSQHQAGGFLVSPHPPPQLFRLGFGGGGGGGGGF